MAAHIGQRCHDPITRGEFVKARVREGRRRSDGSDETRTSYDGSMSRRLDRCRIGSPELHRQARRSPERERPQEPVPTLALISVVIGIQREEA